MTSSDGGSEAAANGASVLCLKDVVVPRAISLRDGVDAGRHRAWNARQGVLWREIKGCEDPLEGVRRMKRELLQVLDEYCGTSVPSNIRHDGDPEFKVEGSYDSARTLQREGEAREFEQPDETREGEAAGEGVGTGTTGRPGPSAECRFSGKRAVLDGKAELGLEYGNTGIWEHTDKGVDTPTGGTIMNATIAGIDVSIPVPSSAFCAWERRVPSAFSSTQGARPRTWGGWRRMEGDTVVAATASSIAASARGASPKTLCVRSGVRVDRSIALSSHPDSAGRDSTMVTSLESDRFGNQAVDTDVLGVARSMPAEFGTVQPSHTVPNRLATRLPPPTSNEVASTSGCEDAMEKDSTFDEKVPSSTAPEVAQSLFQEPVAEEYLGWRAGHSEEDQARPKTSRGLQPASPSPGREASLERARQMRRELLQVLDECCAPSAPGNTRYDGDPQVGVRPTVKGSDCSSRTLRRLNRLGEAKDVEQPEEMREGEASEATGSALSSSLDN